MAFKLDKHDTKRRDGLVETLRELRGKLEDAVSVYNAAVIELQAPITEALTAYNEAVEETRGFVEDIARTAEGAFDDKSERWRDGDKGTAARDWFTTWQNEDFSELTLTFPDELTLPDSETDHDGRLENLPEEASE